MNDVLMHVLCIEAALIPEPDGTRARPPMDCRKIVQVPYGTGGPDKIWHDPLICNGACSYGWSRGYIDHTGVRRNRKMLRELS